MNHCPRCGELLDWDVLPRIVHFSFEPPRVALLRTATCKCGVEHREQPEPSPARRLQQCQP